MTLLFNRCLNNIAFQSLSFDNIAFQSLSQCRDEVTNATVVLLGINATMVRCTNALSGDGSENAVGEMNALLGERRPTGAKNLEFGCEYFGWSNV